jgi:carbonic anhydrase
VHGWAQVLDGVLLPIRDVAQSVREDLGLLHASSLLPKHLSLHGYAYDTLTGQLDMVKSYPPTANRPSS